MIQIITQTQLALLSEDASASPRLRKNLNCHSTNEAACHRLFNALEPGTYVQPHCHLDASKEETILLVKGRLGVLIFEADGSVAQRLLLQENAEQLALTIPMGVFHSIVSLQKGSVFFEAKAGPYRPISLAEKAPWAPDEGTPEQAAYLAYMLEQFS